MLRRMVIGLVGSKLTTQSTHIIKTLWNGKELAVKDQVSFFLAISETGIKVIGILPLPSHGLGFRAGAILQ